MNQAGGVTPLSRNRYSGALLTAFAMALAAHPGFGQAHVPERPLFPFSAAGKTGYIDASGQIVIPAQFEGGRPFQEGLGEIWINHKHGFIDPTGKVVIAPEYDAADNFSEGLAAVGVGADQDGYGDARHVYLCPIQPS